MIVPNAHVAETPAYALADLSVTDGMRAISMAQNESLRPPSPAALAASRAAVEHDHLYPDPDWVELRAAIADVHGIAPGNLLCGAGSMELIVAVAHAFAGPGRRVLSSQYAYALFQSAARFVQSGYDAAKEDDFVVDVDALLAAVRADTRVVFIANPANPTGTHIPNEALRRLHANLADDVLLVIDEAYGEFTDAHQEPLFDLVDRGNVVVLRTFSKAYGLAGARVGWGAFPIAVRDEVRKLLNPNNVSAASQAAATKAMLDQSYMRVTVDQTIDLRDTFIGDLRTLGLQTTDSQTNFALIQFGSEARALRVEAAMRAQGIIMRPMGGYDLPWCLRATLVDRADMQIVTTRLAELTRRSSC